MRLPIIWDCRLPNSSVQTPMTGNSICLDAVETGSLLSNKVFVRRSNACVRRTINYTASYTSYLNAVSVKMKHVTGRQEYEQAHKAQDQWPQRTHLKIIITCEYFPLSSTNARMSARLLVAASLTFSLRSSSSICLSIEKVKELNNSAYTER